MKTFHGIKIALALALALLGSNSWGQSVFTKYGPVAGIQKSTGATYQNTAAASSDVIGLWSGCTGANFLRGDGTCQTPTGTGVTSIGVTAPSWYTVTGSPVTSSGTIAISPATGQAANLFLATPNGTTGAVSERAIVGADLPPINLGSTAAGGVLSTSILPGTNGGTSNGFMSFTGPATALKTFTLPNASATILTTNAAVTVGQGGTGAATLTGLLKGNGTSAFTAATSADVISLWTGTCNSTTFLRADGACIAAGAGSGTVTSLTGGTGVTASPSTITTTGSFAVDQAFSPTWTGTHTFSNSIASNGGATGSAATTSALEFRLTNTGTNANTAANVALGNGTAGIIVGALGTSGTTNGVCSGSSFLHTYICSTGNQPLTFGTQAIDRMAISAAGAVTINAPTSGQALTISGAANSYTTALAASSTSGQSFGSIITAGTTSGDVAMLIRNIASTNLFVVSGAGQITFPALGTTASAANAFIDSSNTNQLLRSTSSARYKRDIGDLVNAERVVMHLRPVRFHSLGEVDSRTNWYYGLVAEEVAKVEPSLVNYDKAGRPDGVQYDRVQVWMLPLVQAMRIEVWALMAIVAVLVAWNIYLTVKVHRVQHKH